MKKRVVVDSDDESDYDAYHGSNDVTDKLEQRVKFLAHQARLREKEAKRHASMARVGELVQDGSVADALLPALVRHLAALRALACTCQAWRAKVRTHFASLAQLDLRRHDMLEGNAAFVFGPLLAHRPDIHVAWLREDDDDGSRRGGYCVLKGMKNWLDRRRRHGKWVLSKYGASQLVMFFMSRAVAKMPELRLVLPREDEHARKHPISFTCGQLSSLKFCNPEGTGGRVGEFKMVQNQLARPAFDIVAGCHLVAALEALTGPVWLQNADLDLSYLHLDDEGARTVALKMRKNAPPKRICLAHTMSRDGSWGMLGVMGKRQSSDDKARVDLSRLQCLLIQGGRLWEREPLLALHSMLCSLGDASKLTKLDLNDSRMGARGMCTLSEHFQESRALHLLEELILHSNNLGNDGLEYLQDHGRVMPKLRFLDIGHNYIDGRVQVHFVDWIGNKADWPCIERIYMFYNSAPLFKLLEKTCALARARCEWEKLLNHQANWLDDPEASDFDVPQGHSASESSGSDDSFSSEEEESNSDEEEEEDHDE